MKSSVLSGRPGGFALTDRAVSMGCFLTGDRILDLGCGSGASVDHLRKKYGLDAIGLEKNLNCHPDLPELISGVAEDIPFPQGSFDGILMECSFSLMEDPVLVLTECRRVLKPEGRLIISGLFARGKPAQINSLGRIDTKENLLSVLENNQFQVEFFEDHSQVLMSWWGQLLLEGSAVSFYNNPGISPELLKELKCGYFLLMAIKRQIKEI